MLILSALQNDVLCEIFNIGIGQSAAVLGALLDDEVLLSVPEIRFLTVSEIPDYLGKNDALMYCVRESFEGAFNGSALLIFPEKNSMALVRAMMGDIAPGVLLPEIQHDALMEVGNIVLNACISSLAEMTGTPFECGLPSVNIGDSKRILGVRIQNHIVMLINIRFELKEQEMKGFVVFIMNSTSYDKLIHAIDSFIARIK